MKTSELADVALDWAVAKYEGIEDQFWWDEPHDETGFRPSTDWAQGGPIIERERITVQYMDRNYFRAQAWLPDTRTYTSWYYGRTYLEVAMRCYVASKLGDEVEVPEELK